MTAGSTVAERAAVAPAPVAPSRRLASLDAFRGLAIVGMILVNVPGDVVWSELSHAAWNGLTAADLVFPAFLVAVGASLALSKRASPARIARRVLTLIALGLLVNRATFTGPWRYPGVLQRIAVCYLLGSLIVRFPRRWVAIAAGALLAGYAVILRLGGATPTHSLGGTLDAAVFGPSHIYHRLGYDPEGLLGSVAATAGVLIGYLAVVWLRARPRTVRTGALLAVGALGLIAAGRAADGFVAINKRLWSPGFTLVTAGAALLVLAGLYVIVEVGGWRAVGWPLEVIGANAILVYVASEFGEAGLRHIKVTTIDLHVWLYCRWFASWAGTRPGSLLFSLAFVSALWVVAALLWRAKLFLKV